VIDKLVDARLLVIAEQEDGARVEIIHEALLGAWPRVQEWIREDADSARMRDQLRSAARQWDERGQPPGLLWRDEALAELERWRSRHEAQGLMQAERAFADASRTAAASGRRRRRMALVAAFAVLGTARAVMYWLRGEAAEQRELAEQRAAEARRQGELANAQEHETQALLVRNYVEGGQQALLAGNLTDAETWLGEAYKRGGHSPAVRFMLARAKEARAAELVTFDAHAGRVITAAFNPDGKRLLTAGQDTAAHVWDAATGRELFTLRDHAPPVVAAWSARGEIATGDANGQLRLWTGDGQLIASFWKPEKSGKPPAVTALAFTRDGARVAVGKSDGTVAVGDPHQGQLPSWKQDTSSVDALAFDPAGQRIAISTGESGKVGIWSVDGRVLHWLPGHTSSVWHVVFDATGERVITGSIDRTARVWEANTGRLLHRLVGHEDRVTNIAIDNRSRRIATASADTTVRIWSLDDGELLTTLRGHTSQVNGVVVSRDGQLITASSDGTARVWDLARGVQTAVYLHGGFLSRVTLDPSGERLATASWSGTAKIWDLRRQSRLAAYASPVADDGDAKLLRSEVHGGRLVRIGTHGIAAWDLAAGRSWTWAQGTPAIVAGALSADGRAAVAVDAGGTLHVLDADGHASSEISVGPGITSVAVHPGGRRAVTCGPRGEVAVWDLATKERLASRSLGAVNALKLSEDGRVMVAFEQNSDLGGKGTAWLLDSDLAHEIRLDHETGLPDATFSPDGSRLVTLGQDGGARIWTRDGRLEATLKHPGPVGFAAWSSDGSWLATGTYGGTLTIWTRTDWQARRQIEAHTNFITALTIGDHDSLIASAGGDGIVKVWDAAQLFQVGRIPSGSNVTALAIERDQLLIAGPLATQSWRCDR
jgi:WD40 repeat protein